jgi:poly(3-hydroxybutyrate) depolymerase
MITAAQYDIDPSPALECRPMSRYRSVGLCLVLLSAIDAYSQLIEETIPPGANYDKARFRLWVPSETKAVRAVVVLTTGSNGDGRPMVDDAAWQDFARSHGLALVGCQLTDKPHDQNFIEEYANASQGSGQALLDALNRLADRSGHAELARAPLLLWGMSAGGEFNYEFVAWKPERVLAFVVNKGGIYYSALVSQAARNVPGILFTGGNDLEFRSDTIAGLFAVNRRAGALWALAEEPGVGHVVGRSKDMSLIFFEEALAMRLDEQGKLKTLSEKNGFIGDIKAKTFQSVGGSAPNSPTAWLPNVKVARAWQALVSGKPFER